MLLKIVKMFLNNKARFEIQTFRTKTASMFWFVKRTFDQKCAVVDRSSVQAT